jgi:succinoglycan biosynthesis transport protein ExoP
MMQAQFQIKDLKGIIRRRKKSFIIPFLLIMLFSVCAALILPAVYLAETKILVEGQQIPSDYVQSTITSFLEERLKVLTEQITSRSKLLEIIKQFNLYPELREKKTTEEIVQKMRKDIKFKTISANVINQKTGRGGVATVAFTLSYEGKKASVVQKVANVLASYYIEENLRVRERQASVTTDFLKEELKSLDAQIREEEEKISQFKKEHFGELPANNIVNLQALERLERERDRIRNNIDSLEEQKIYLKGRIATVDPLTPVVVDGEKMAMNPKERLKALRLKLITLQSTLSEKHPDIKRLKKQIAELEAQVGETDDSVAKVKRLHELQGQLATMRGKLGPKHPDVIKLSKEVGVLSKEVDKLLTANASTEVAEEQPDNPTYISLRTQIVFTDMRIKALMEEDRKVQDDLKKLNRKIEIAPTVEKEYMEMTRDYEGAKRKYHEILNQLLTAKVAKGMEETQRGERFTITEPAPLPEKPYKPNRLVIILVGCILALGAGTGLACLQEFMDTSIKNADEINGLLGVPVFSVLPYLESDEERRLRRKKRVVWTLAGVVVVVVALILIDRFVMPLDIVWVKIQRRLDMIVLPF